MHIPSRVINASETKNQKECKRLWNFLNKFSKANSFANSSSPKSIHIYTKREEIILHVESLLKYSFWVIRNEVIIPLNIISYLFFELKIGGGGGCLLSELDT